MTTRDIRNESLAVLNGQQERWTFQLYHDNRGWQTHPRTFATREEAAEFAAGHPAFYPKRVIKLDNRTVRRGESCLPRADRID